MGKKDFGTQFLSYYDDEGKIVEGYFFITKITDGYIEFLSKENIVRIPWVRILKNKEKKDGGNN